MISDNKTRIVVDTNVLAVAEGIHPTASDECRMHCIKVANQIQKGQTVSVDADDLIIGEYLKVLKDSPASGVGKKLALFLSRRRWDASVCRKVPITQGTPPSRFNEVPSALTDIDEDDHMFIAVAAADDAVILQALDNEWWERKADFAACKLDVQFLCAADLLSREDRRPA
jgi:hypothetical protein